MMWLTIRKRKFGFYPSLVNDMTSVITIVQKNSRFGISLQLPKRRTQRQRRIGNAIKNEEPIL